MTARSGTAGDYCVSVAGYLGISVATRRVCVVSGLFGSRCEGVLSSERFGAAEREDSGRVVTGISLRQQIIKSQ